LRNELREASGGIRQCGGGKSTLARRMAGLTRLPLHVIDMIQFGTRGAKVPHDESLRA